jgi:hypothetical protein
MSQSDYIEYKRTSRQLADFNQNSPKMPAVLNMNTYVSYKKFSLENTIINTAPSYLKVVPPNTPVVFGMVKQCASSEPTFTLCSGTDQRPNRPDPSSDFVPSFRTPAVGTISKQNIMKWYPIANTKLCNCATI